MKFGLISDTHDFLDPRVAKIFAGVDHILHAGDIGKPRVLLELEAIAPVTAVGGNTDDPAFGYSETEIVALAGRKFLLHHIVNPHALTANLKARIAREKPDLVMFGHTHKPFCEIVGGILFFNPGYAGQQRFSLERSVALLRCDKNGFHHEFVKL